MSLVEEVRQKEPLIRRDAVTKAAAYLRTRAEKKIEKAYRRADWLVVIFLFVLFGMIVYFTV